MDSTTNVLPAEIVESWPDVYCRGERKSVAGNRLWDCSACGGDRYAFDFAHCGLKSDWYQYDTAQDANYYGIWVNPVKRQIVSYTEGDIRFIQADDADGYRAELASMDEWQRGYDGEDRRHIDDHDGQHWDKLA